MQLLTSELLTLLIALYGAALSTVLAIREVKRDKPKVLVRCRMALAAAPEYDLWEFVEVCAVNTGHRSVEITAAGLSMSNGYQFIPLRSKKGPIPLPKKIDIGESVSVLIDYPDVEQALREQQKVSRVVFTSAFVRDAEGNEYKSGLPRVLKDRKLAK